MHFNKCNILTNILHTLTYRYIIAICLRHVEVEFPYISDTGTHTPESCIFSQALNIVSFLVILTVYVRYKQIEQSYRDYLSPQSAFIMKINWIALCVGSVSAFGLSIVANFQETNVFRVHMVGAMMAFGFGVVYAWLQTFMSFKMIPIVNTKRVAIIRLILSIIMTITFTTSSICGPMAFRRFSGKDPTKWRPWDGGWHLHIASTCCEWISAMSLDFFILSYVREMHLISLSSPRVMFFIESVTLPNQDTSLSYAAGIDTEVSIRSSNGGRRATNTNVASNLVSSSDGNLTAASEANETFNQSIIG